MISPTGKRPRGGFTLLEVLVAVAIFAVGVTAVLQGFQVSMHAMERARQVMVCSRLAAQRLDDVRLACRGGLAPSSGSGRCEQPFEMFQWRISAREASVGGASAGSVGEPGGGGALYEVSVEVWERTEADGVSIQSHLFLADSEKSHVR